MSNETKITIENAWNRDHLRTKGNHELDDDKKKLFQVFVETRDPSFNP